MGASGGKKTNSQTKKGAKSSRYSVENEQEQENLIIGQKPTIERGIHEVDVNQFNAYRHISPAARLKQPFFMHEMRGNLAHSRSSYGNLHEKNRQIPSTLRVEPSKSKRMIT